MDPVMCAIIAALSFFAGGAVGATLTQRDHDKEVKDAQGCPRCLRFHRLANLARKIAGLKFVSVNYSATKRVPDALATVNAIAEIAGELPPPIKIVKLDPKEAAK